jgi:AraC-like DNA-binding protein
MTYPTYGIIHGVNTYPDTRFPLAVIPSSHGRAALHGHDFMEIVLVRSGKGTHVHCSPGPRGRHAEYEIVENDVFIVPRGWVHGYESGSAVEIYNIVYGPELISKDFFGSANSAESFGLFAGKPQREARGLIHKIHLRHSTRLAAESIIKTIRRETMTRRRGYELLAKARLLEFLTLLERASDDRSIDATESSEPNAIADAIRFLEDHYFEPMGLQEVADAVGLNPNYLCERFGQVAGISPVRYLTRLRLEHAKALLVTTDLPVTSVAMKSGFSDSSYFARVFHKSVGRTPRAYRAELRVA